MSQNYRNRIISCDNFNHIYRIFTKLLSYAYINVYKGTYINENNTVLIF